MSRYAITVNKYGRVTVRHAALPEGFYRTLDVYDRDFLSVLKSHIKALHKVVLFLNQNNLTIEQKEEKE